jgi:TPR repeat protein
VGDGIEKNPYEALKLYNLAAAQGNKKAVRAASELKAKLDTTTTSQTTTTTAHNVDSDEDPAPGG